MRTLVNRVILVAGLCFSLLVIFLAILFWLVMFLLRNHLLGLSGLPCMLLPVSPLLPLRFSVFEFCHFNYDASWSGSLVGSICVGLVFLSIQLPYVFWLEYLIHLHLRLLLIGTYSSPFYPFCTCVPCSLSHSFSPFFKSSPFIIYCSAGLRECILSAFFCLGNSLFHLPF